MNSKPIYHGSIEEARHQFHEDFERLSMEPCWMAAVWRVRDGKVVCERVTTFEFPKGDMVAAMAQLGLKLHDGNFAPEPKPEPLPTAFPDQWSSTDELDEGEGFPTDLWDGLEEKADEDTQPSGQDDETNN